MTAKKIGYAIVCDGGGCLNVAQWEICGLSAPLRLCKECAEKLQKALISRAKQSEKGANNGNANKKG